MGNRILRIKIRKFAHGTIPLEFRAPDFHGKVKVGKTQKMQF